MNSGNPLWDYSPVVKARFLGGHRVWLRFKDGLEGELDLGSRLWGPVFEPLKDPTFFARFKVDHTLCWPNGADFSPEYLWDRVRFEKLGIKPPRKYVRGFLRERPPAPTATRTGRTRSPAKPKDKRKPSRARRNRRSAGS